MDSIRPSKLGESCIPLQRESSKGNGEPLRGSPSKQPA